MGKLPSRNKVILFLANPIASSDNICMPKRELDKRFDMNEYLRVDADNRKVAQKNLAQFWPHFQSAADFYGELFKVKSAQFLSDEFVPRRFFMGGCYINLVKAVSSILNGHIRDSNIFTRRTLESVRYSAFIREVAEMNELWLEGASNPKAAEKFRSKFNDWFSYSGKQGGKMVKAELEGSDVSYSIAADYGPHPNQFLLFGQNEIAKTQDGYQLYLWFHDIEETTAGALRAIYHFLWVVGLHLRVIEWWIHKSGLPFALGEEFAQKVTDARGEHRQLMRSLLPGFREELSPEDIYDDVEFD